MIFGLLLVSFITAWVDDMGYFFSFARTEPSIYSRALHVLWEMLVDFIVIFSLSKLDQGKKSKKQTKKLGEQSELHFKSSSFTYMCAWSGHFSEVGVDAKERATRENKMSLTTQKLTCGWRDPLLPISFAAETKKYIFDCWFWGRNVLAIFILLFIIGLGWQFRNSQKHVSILSVQTVTKLNLKISKIIDDRGESKGCFEFWWHEARRNGGKLQWWLR